MAIDLVCGMMVDEKKAKLKSDYNGKTFYFCAPSCKATFDKSPAKFTGNSGAKGIVAIEATAKPIIV